MTAEAWALISLVPLLALLALSGVMGRRATAEAVAAAAHEEEDTP